MYTVVMTAGAQAEYVVLPLKIQARVLAILERLQSWPDVSGAKPLRGKLKSNYRIRTGDYRVLFFVTVANETVTVWKIDNRRDVYED